MKNVVEFPFSKDERIRTAYSMFQNGRASEALAEFIKLADEGHNEALSFIGNIYEFGGDGVYQDFDKARQYYERSLETYGSVAACLRLIRFYYYGYGVEKDCCKAVEYCRALLQEHDHPQAHFYIGKMHLDGCCLDKDVELAKTHFKESWSGGYVFGLTGLGHAEQRSGHWLKGLALRLKAGITAYRLARHDPNDPRIRNP